MSACTTAPARAVVLDRRLLRRALGALWLVDAALQSDPRFFTAGWWRDDLAQSAMAEPAAVARMIVAVAGGLAHLAPLASAAAVVVQAGIGLALLLGRGERAALLASLPWALAVWVVGEGLGMLPTGFASLPSGAPGAALLYAVLAVLAYPVHDQAGAEVGPAGVGAWAVLWAGSALLPLTWHLPAGQVLAANVAELSAGAPAPLAALGAAAADLVGSHGLLVAVLLSTAGVLVGLGALSRRGRRPALGAGLALSALFWVAGQYLGGVPAGGATDPGTAPVVALLALALWPRSAPRPGGPGPGGCERLPLQQRRCTTGGRRRRVGLWADRGARPTCGCAM